MKDSLLNPGEFAKLARTTKRTVLWYAKAGILKPHKVDESGYRWYTPQQILDFQSVRLMRKLGFSVADIAAQLAKGHSMRDLFEQKRSLLEQQIGQLQRMLNDTNRYYRNLDSTGTLVRAELKQVESFDMYCIVKEGPYAQIKDYSAELRAAFDTLPGNTVYLTAFIDPGYRPVRARMKIGVVCNSGMQLKPNAMVSRETVPAYQALAYTHQGSTTLLSLLWQELEIYRLKQHLAHDNGLPFASIEFYAADNSPYPDPEDSLITEIQLPVKA